MGFRKLADLTKIKKCAIIGHVSQEGGGVMEYCFQCDTSVTQEEFDYKQGICIYCIKWNKINKEKEGVNQNERR